MKIDIRYRLTRLFFGIVWFFFVSAEARGQETILFWNVENAFWPADDPERADDEFTPQGERHWTFGRFRQKMVQLTRVVLAASEGKGPLLMGVAEVEGDSVMHYWTQHTPLRDYRYRYMVTRGNDQRGIEVGLLYRIDAFRPIAWAQHEVALPQGHRPTRPVLHVSGVVASSDTVDVLVCHLPSQRGGAKRSAQSREAAWQTVCSLRDSLEAIRLRPYVIVMGDMNQPAPDQPRRGGSHKYAGRWSLLDQMYFSAPFRSDTSRLRLTAEPQPFSLPFMLTDDETHLGHRPLRSFYGYRYEGGYSDHLPLKAKVIVNVGN